MATRVLADHGATVVRVESQHRLDAIRERGRTWPTRTAASRDTVQWHSVNAGKLSLQLNLATEEARSVVRDLAGWSDVVLESFTPKAMRAWGLDYESLRGVNPELIMVSSCLMGQTGPMASFAGFGNLAGAITGFYQITGWPDRQPAGPFLAYTDYTSPRLTLVVLLAALDHRRRTGEGQYIDFSQGEAALHFLGPALVGQARDGRVFDRRGNDDDDMAPHGVYPVTGEDRWVAIACAGDEQWTALAEVVGRGELAGLSSVERQERRRELDGILAGLDG